MVWYVLDSIVSPDSDTVFSLVSSPYNLKFVLWYDAERYLFPGDRLETSDRGWIINGDIHPVTLLDVSIFRTLYWQKLRAYNQHCPGNNYRAENTCTYQHKCRIKKCPFTDS